MVHRQVRLSRLTDEAARDEGFADSDQFEAAWAGIHGSYDGAARVWRVTMRVRHERLPVDDEAAAA